MSPHLHPAPLSPPDPLADELVSCLVEAVAEQAAALPAVRAFAATPLRTRVLGRATRSAPAGRPLFTARLRDAVLQSLAPGVSRVALYRSTGTGLRPGEPLRTCLLSLAPGACFELPAAAAGVQRDWLGLAGEVEVGATRLGLHDYLVMPANDTLIRLTSAGGARLYLRESIAPESDSPCSQVVTSRSAQADWHDYGPGIRRRVLWSSGGEAAMLYHTLPGARVPAHGHRRDEECLMLDGDLYLDDLLLARGDYQLAPAGTGHASVFTDGGVVIYAHGDLDLDFRAEVASG